MTCCESRIQSDWTPTHRVLVFMPTRRCAASFDVMLDADGGARTVGAFERGEGPSLRCQPGGWSIPLDSDLPDANEAVIFRIRPRTQSVADWEALAM
ncbi:hypothetical protein HED60_03760 [Planctomycetales bacterium ZRK34]|nr:hypothetical protein HED60_03760 [Planctomycetales bacterium ZRK34]